MESCGLGIPGSWFNLEHRLRDTEANAKNIGMVLHTKKTALRIFNPAMQCQTKKEFYKELCQTKNEFDKELCQTKNEFYKEFCQTKNEFYKKLCQPENEFFKEFVKLK